ncbi:MAG: VOC family protein [Ghiorsea sp.]
MNQHEKISYLEFPSSDLNVTKTFFTTAFNWSFTDYGPEYTAFSEAGIDGGFFQSNLTADTKSGSVLVVLYSKDIESTAKRIKEAGGSVIKPTFSFPGGRRFHFCDPIGNEYAVWSE